MGAERTKWPPPKKKKKKSEVGYLHLVQSIRQLSINKQTKQVSVITVSD